MNKTQGDLLIIISLFCAWLLWQQTERKRIVVEEVPTSERSLTVLDKNGEQGRNDRKSEYAPTGNKKTARMRFHVS